MKRLGTTLLVLVAALVGCSKSPFDADVSGRITMDGAPMPPGVVVFSPTSRGKNASRGRIEEDGSYFLVTKHDRGIDPGEYRVTLQVFEKGPPPGPGERAPELPPLVPKKYLDPNTSGLQYTVEPGSNTIDIAVSKQDGGK